ncbi:macro domain-containing protein [Photobacterium phosphoreum]|uniref:macro domain-containing protein n=1 Tax=Photobacterium phosphoreum TaxID=659 RepID=UPI0039B0B2E9
MIEFVDGDFFDFDADIRINTVNCVGVMGAGVALAFKNRYPEMFKEYVKQCKANQITPGNPSVWKEGDMFSKGIEIINFPTKDNWRNPSEYEYIERGLIWLSAYLKDRDGLIVTLPALGCGHGGLDWEKVKSLIIKYLGITPNRILVFEPGVSRKTGANLTLTPEKITRLKVLGVKVLSKNDLLYPVGLMRYTEKALYILGDGNSDFDISVISSTNPSEQEKEIVIELIDYCQIKNLRILFGGSAFDKKMASISMSKGIRTGVFLPSGIFNSAEKMKVKGNNSDVSIFSIGDPFKPFDRKEYIPSVLSRIFIGRCVFFTTSKLSWIKKQNKILKKNRVNSCFINYKGLHEEDYLAAIDIDSQPLEVVGNSISFEELRF